MAFLQSKKPLPGISFNYFNIAIFSWYGKYTTIWMPRWCTQLTLSVVTKVITFPDSDESTGSHPVFRTYNASPGGETSFKIRRHFGSSGRMSHTCIIPLIPTDTCIGKWVWWGTYMELDNPYQEMSFWIHGQGPDQACMSFHRSNIQSYFHIDQSYGARTTHEGTD